MNQNQHSPEESQEKMHIKYTFDMTDVVLQIRWYNKENGIEAWSFREIVKPEIENVLDYLHREGIIDQIWKSIRKRVYEKLRGTYVKKTIIHDQGLAIEYEFNSLWNELIKKKIISKEDYEYISKQNKGYKQKIRDLEVLERLHRNWDTLKPWYNQEEDNQ